MGSFFLNPNSNWILMKTMLNALKIVMLGFLVFLASSCSVYQSEGRKFLEEQAFRFRNQSLVVKVQKVSDSCAQSQHITLEYFETSYWQMIPDSTDDSDWVVFESTSPDFPIEIIIAKENQDSQKGVVFCQLLYEHPSERDEHLLDDIKLAIEKASRL